MRFLEINLNHPAHYLTFGPFSVSAGHLAIIIFMFLIFAAALFLPFPDHDDHKGSADKATNSSRGER